MSDKANVEWFDAAGRVAGRVDGTSAGLFTIALAIKDMADAYRECHGQAAVIGALADGVFRWRAGDEYDDTYNDLLKQLGAPDE